MPDNSTEPQQLREHALAIWQAGVEAVNTRHLVAAAVALEDDALRVGPVTMDRREIESVVVVGGGKAAHGMVQGLTDALGGRDLPLSGWVNVPDALAGESAGIHLHAARPVGINEPTEAAVEGTQRMLGIVDRLGPHDVCLCLLTGGGSALVTAPPAGVSLSEKLTIIRRLQSSGASIHQLNTVRRCLSNVKGGRLAQRCQAGRLITLLISDVLGDAIEAIASGPTVIGSRDPQAALSVLEQFLPPAEIPASVTKYLSSPDAAQPQGTSPIEHLILGNLQMAIDAAAVKARQLGYRVECEPIQIEQPQANQAGRDLADSIVNPTHAGTRTCVLSGGEPVVTLVESSRRGLGGRNQQLVLAALDSLLAAGLDQTENPVHFALLSGGTDGEDGTTDAAGAVIDLTTIDAVRKMGLNPSVYLDTNDAYTFFTPLGCLMQTGWTGTNVCDLRVLLCGG